MNNLEHAFTGYEFLLSKFSYQLYVTGLLDEDNGELIDVFLEQYDFSDENITFDSFRFHYLCFKTAYTRSSLPF